MRELIGKGLLTAAAASSVLSMTGGYAAATDSAATAAGSPGLLSGNSVQAPIEVPVNVCGNTVNPIGVVNPAAGNSCGNSSGAQAGPTHRPAHAKPVAPRAEPATHAVPAQAPQAGPSRTGHDTADSSTHGANPREHGGGSAPAKGAHHHSRDDHGGSSAAGAATNSPGLLSGNLLQAPLDIPLNACGNSVDLVGVLNPAFGNTCANDDDGVTPHNPVRPPAPIDPNDPRDPSTPPGDRSVEPPAVPVDHHPQLPEQPRPVEESDVMAQLATTGSDANLLAAAGMSAGLLIGGGILYRRSHATSRR
ncbi:chaplin family protein [Streptomyces sp. PSRA5]|uniref:chaplin family protein n=1 Tax=Streptomyces panacea TaxID=3035064 RepID=UPI00339BDFEE